MAASWDFYLARIGELPASIFVNSSLADGAAKDSNPDILLCRIPVISLRENKLPTVEADEVIRRFEDAAKDMVEASGDGIYAGHLSLGHAITFHYYTASGSALLATFNASKVLQAISYFECEWQSDPEWSFYHDFLYPDPQTRNSIENRKVLQSLERSGDDGTAVRDIDHYAYFGAEALAHKLAVKVTQRGYRIVQDVAATDDDGQWLVLFRKPAKPVAINDDTWELTELVQELGGSYDGWECDVVKKRVKWSLFSKP